jgi:hypothetical protein
MWIVKVALRRPYTFIVLALLIAIIGPLMIPRMPTDIFPDINIPIISVIWNDTGLPPTVAVTLPVDLLQRRRVVARPCAPALSGRHRDLPGGRLGRECGLAGSTGRR